MKYPLLLFFCWMIIIVFPSQSTAQHYPTWYQLTKIEKPKFHYNNSSYVVDINLDLVYTSSIDLKNMEFRHIILGTGEKGNESIKNKVYFCRGSIKEMEVLMFNTEAHNFFENAELFYLPELKISDSLTYNTYYQYPTDFFFKKNVSFDHLSESKIHKINQDLVFSLTAKYDSIGNTLSYTNSVKSGSVNYLVFDGKEVKENFKIYLDEYLPWQTNFQTFTYVDSVSRKNLVKFEKFKSIGSGRIFSIDSVDLINKKILLSQHHSSLSKYTISGHDLLNGKKIDLSDFQKDYLLVHYWGSWCAPCIKNLAKLVEVYQSNPELDYLSVAVEGVEAKTVELIKKYNLIWPQLFFQKSEDYQSSSNTEVFSFPTYLIVDRDRNFIAKCSDIDSLIMELKSLPIKP